MDIIYGKKAFDTRNDIRYLEEKDLDIPAGSEGYKKPLEVLSKIENARIDGEKISHMFHYSDLSLWWFLYPSIFPSIKRTVNFIEKFEQIISEIKPRKLTIKGEFENLKLIKNICDKERIGFSYSKERYFKYLISRWLFSKFKKLRFKQVTKKKNKTRIELFKSKKKKIPNLKNKIIFAVPTAYRRHVFRPANETLIDGEYIQGPIIELIKKMNFDVVGMDLDYTFKGQYDILSARLDEDMPWFPIEIILKNFQKDDASKNFLEIYRRIISDSRFHEKFNFQDINFWKSIEEDFEKLTFLPHLPFYINLINALKIFFEKNKPAAVFLPYETGPLALAIIKACEKNNIQTIGIQHGITYLNNPDYNHSDFYSRENLYGMPLPNTILVFGEYVKKLLCEEGNYPKDKIVIFGNPEFFNLENILESLQSRNSYLKRNFQNKKIILFTTGKMQRYYKTYGSVDYDEQVWRKLLTNFGNNHDYYLVLKPHPSENISAYEKIRNELKISNAEVIQGELFEMIYASSVMISIGSTTILDAICLHKPVIQVKFKNITSPIPYEKYGVVLPSELDDLSKNIEILLEKKDIQDDLLKKGFKFIKEQYNIPEHEPQLLLKSILK